MITMVVMLFLVNLIRVISMVSPVVSFSLVDASMAQIAWADNPILKLVIWCDISEPLISLLNASDHPD